MRNLLKELNSLKKSSIKQVVDSRLKEFNQDHLFSELCFCLLTANFTAERGIKIQKEIGKGFEIYSENKLSKELKRLGHRFPNVRAKYIVEARKHDLILEREWLVKNVKGFGYKEASHFLRNVGFKDYSIIDFHIVDLLVKNNLIERPKTLTKNKYLEIENILKVIAKKVDMNLAELDLYLWYKETGKVLK